MARSYARLMELVEIVKSESDYQIATDAMLLVNREVGEFGEIARTQDNGMNAVLWGNYTEAQRIGATAQVAWKALYDATWGEK